MPSEHATAVAASERSILLSRIERLEAELSEARDLYAAAQRKARPVNEAVSRAFTHVHNREDDLRKAKIELARLLDIGANGSALSVGVGGDDV